MLLLRFLFTPLARTDFSPGAPGGGGGGGGGGPAAGAAQGGGKVGDMLNGGGGMAGQGAGDGRSGPGGIDAGGMGGLGQGMMRGSQGQVESKVDGVDRGKRDSPHRYGLLGLLGVIRMTNPDLNMLALGTDLTTMGLDLNAPECLFTSFASPWAESPSLGKRPFTLPACYMQAVSHQNPHLLLPPLRCFRLPRAWRFLACIQLNRGPGIRALCLPLFASTYPGVFF